MKSTTAIKTENAKRIRIDHNKLQEILSYFKDRKVKVKVNNTDNYHMTITGDERTVHFYPTTGTINCNPCDKYKPFKLRGAHHETALARVVDLANIGY